MSREIKNKNLKNEIDIALAKKNNVNYPKKFN